MAENPPVLIYMGALAMLAMGDLISIIGLIVEITFFFMFIGMSIYHYKEHERNDFIVTMTISGFVFSWVMIGIFNILGLIEL